MLEQLFLGPKKYHVVIFLRQLDGLVVGEDCYFSYKKVPAELLNQRPHRFFFKLPHSDAGKQNPFV